jgi:ribosome-binding factor A
VVRTVRDPGANHRRERIDTQLRQELALAIAGDVKDPRLAMVTVVAVACTTDLSYARVKVSVLADDPEREQVLRVLRGMTGFLRHRLGERLEHMRRIPKLDIRLDESIAYGVRVSQLLEQLETAPKARRGPASG